MDNFWTPKKNLFLCIQCHDVRYIWFSSPAVVGTIAH